MFTQRVQCIKHSLEILAIRRNLAMRTRNDNKAKGDRSLYNENEAFLFHLSFPIDGKQQSRNKIEIRGEKMGALLLGLFIVSLKFSEHL